MRWYRRLFNISFKDHVTNEEVREKIQAAIGEYDELLDPGQETEAMMFWSCFMVFWFSKDNSTGHSERKKQREADGRRGGKTISKSGHKWTLPVQLGQLKKGQNGKGLLRIHL